MVTLVDVISSLDAAMGIGIGQEHKDLRQAVRQFLGEVSSTDQVRSLMATETGYNRAAWDRMARELQLQAMTIPERFGGAGFSNVELCLVLEEMGRALLCSPFFSTVVLGVSALLASADEPAKEELLPLIASGQCLITLAVNPGSHAWDIDNISCQASRAGNGWVISGSNLLVLDGHIADVILFPARTPRGPSLFRVAGGTPGMRRSPVPTLDQTRKITRVDLDQVPAVLVGTAGGIGTVLEKTADLAALGLAAEQLGGAGRCLEMAVDYARTRVQFGQPIGTFQAIKHKCADMFMRVEDCRSAVSYAAWAAAECQQDAPAMAVLAQALSCDCFDFCAAECLQVHGALGFTWEHDCHLFLKRALASRTLFGDSAHHRELLLRHIS
jgi:alkylation response protein AidB-like acyl-CoA dehydrogenase